jgi:hypothetical protein
MPSNLKEQMAAKSNEELLNVLAKTADWTPEALAAAKEELDERQVDIKLPEQEEQKPVVRDLRGLTSFMKFALELAVLLTVLTIGFDLLQIYSMGHAITGRAYWLGSREFAAINILRVAWTVVVFITFYFWVYFMNNNVRALGAKGLKYGSVWAVGCFFVPFLNLWKPLEMMGELHKASQNSKSWQEIETPSILGFWWAGWIFSGFLHVFSSIESRSAGSDSSHELYALYYLFIFSHIIAIGLYLTTRKLISSIAQGQNQAKN